MSASAGEKLPALNLSEIGAKIDGTHPRLAEEFAIFPGDLPKDPELALTGWHTEHGDTRFVRFRPPNLVPVPSGGFASFPNIRLDRAIQALIGDRLA